MMGLKHQAASARKWRAAIREIERHIPPYLPPVWFLTDPERVPDPIAVIRALPDRAGVIYRHYGASDRYEVATSMSALCHASGRALLIAADPVLAKHVEADGVHWPEAKLREARSWRGCFSLQTASAHSPMAVRRAAQAGMDAALLSSIYASSSPSAGTPIGASRLRAIARTSHLPIYGLGGLNASNALSVSRHAGIAAIEGLLL